MNIAIISSGGDSPGMNPCIADLVLLANQHGHRTWYFTGGYPGIRDELLHPLAPCDVRGWHKMGGTNIRSGRLPELRTEAMQRRLVAVLRKYQIDALVILGGDGSFQGAKALSAMDGETNYIGIPCTIDNDIAGSDYSLGFDTALNKLSCYIGDITDTAISMYPRVFLVETLGGKDSYFARAAVEMGISDFSMLHGQPVDVDQLCEQIKSMIQQGHMRYALGTVAEEYPGLFDIIEEMKQKLQMPVRYNNVSYQQRGGIPTALELMHAAGFARYALHAAEAGIRDQYVVSQNGTYGYCDFAAATHKKL